jgi:hypothetical protein
VLNKRKSVIGYVTYLVAMRVAKRVIRQRTQSMRASVSAATGSRQSRALAFGVAAAAALAALAAAVRRGRGEDQSAD